MRAALFTILALVALQLAHAQVPSSVQSPGPAIAQQCTSCHGERGEGRTATQSPRIAGQPRQYLARQLRSYANGTRQHPTMAPIARALSPQDIESVAAHYEQLVAPITKDQVGAEIAQPALQEGRTLAELGNRARRIQACNNCHGPQGTGEPPALPYLAGLDATYLEATLRAWQKGTRRNDAGGQMAPVAHALTADDIAAVAQYYASLSPPAPPPPDVVQAPGPQSVTTRGSTPATTPSASAPLMDRVGIDHGSPTGGDTHGEGATGAERPDAPGRFAAAAAPTVPSTRAANPARGRALLASGEHGCSACHRIADIRGARGVVGPSLDGVANRSFIAGRFPNTPAVMVAFLLNPPALIPETGMPNVGLTREQAEHIAAYLYTLEAPSDP